MNGGNSCVSYAALPILNCTTVDTDSIGCTECNSGFYIGANNLCYATNINYCTTYIGTATSN